jgi:hypothetical protein
MLISFLMAKLKKIAREIAAKVRGNITIDWTTRVSARAKLMVLVRARLINMVTHRISNRS